jgi:hypothetical protein
LRLNFVVDPMAHYDVLLILDLPIADLREKVAERMQPFKVDWDDAKPWRWDWYSLPDDGPFTDSEVIGIGGAFDVPSRICRMSWLPADYGVAAAITPDGTWHDLEDFGWRLVDGESPQNKEALARWHSRFREIVAQHQDCIGIVVHCHG